MIFHTSSSKSKSSWEFKYVAINGEDLVGHLKLYELSDLQFDFAPTGSSKLFQICFATMEKKFFSILCNIVIV